MMSVSLGNSSSVDRALISLALGRSSGCCAQQRYSSESSKTGNRFSLKVSKFNVVSLVENLSKLKLEKFTLNHSLC